MFDVSCTCVSFPLSSGGRSAGRDTDRQLELTRVTTFGVTVRLRFVLYHLRPFTVASAMVCLRVLYTHVATHTRATLMATHPKTQFPVFASGGRGGARMWGHRRARTTSPQRLKNTYPWAGEPSHMCMWQMRARTSPVATSTKPPRSSPGAGCYVPPTLPCELNHER